MALSTYTELKKSIINWSHRGDMDLLIDDFILLAEIDMFKETAQHEALEVREMETTSTATIDAQALSLPDNFKSMRSMKIIGDTISDLIFNTPDAMVLKTGTGRPCYYAVTSQVECDIAPDQDYSVEMNYYKSPDGLSSSNTSNVILTNHADIYLYGALWALFTHADDEQQAMKYYQRFSLAINGANQADGSGRYGTAPYMKLSGSHP